MFIGSGTLIKTTGPAAFVTSALTGAIIVLVMRMLAEMAVARPSTGSFADYARDALGPWAGFSVGWLYWYFWVIVVGFEAVAGAQVLQYWIDSPLWLLSLILMVAMTATNLFSVSSFGEFEYWFAGIKVGAIVVFLTLASLFVLGFWPGRSMDFSNLWAHGGFFPHGIPAIFSSIIIVIFSMVGVSKTFTNQKRVLNNIYLSFFYGAKIGIIQDPFGLKGKPTLLAATTPIPRAFAR